MNFNYISTESLYDSGAHLSHARTYSHKYIKREPDGKGRYKYYYKTDVGGMATSIAGNRPDTHYSSYSREPGRYTSAEARSLKTNRFREATSYKVPSVVQSGPGRMAKQFREADKASQIYREGLSQNNKDYKSHTNKPSAPKVPKEYQEALESNSRKNVYFNNLPYDEQVKQWENNGHANVFNVYDEKNNSKNKNSNTTVLSTKGTEAVDRIKDVANTAIDAISNTAKNTYDSGKKFLQNLFK